jgi:CBS domain-containing protein
MCVRAGCNYELGRRTHTPTIANKDIRVSFEVFAMQVRSICQRLVFTINATDEVTRAAELMREKRVGYLVVVDPLKRTEHGRPVGVLTDRDIVVSVVARGIDPTAVRVGDIMSLNPVTAQESDSMEVALRRMSQFGVRRLPVLNDRSDLVGVIALDDVLKVIAGDAQDLVNAIRNEREVEGVARQ